MEEGSFGKTAAAPLCLILSLSQRLESKLALEDFGVPNDIPHTPLASSEACALLPTPSTHLEERIAEDTCR